MVGPDPAPELVSLAFEGLRRMQLPSGLFCEELVDGFLIPGDRSIRYTLMVYLGLLKADAAGHRPDFDLERIRAALVEGLDAPHLRPGDIGLYLWADARGGHGRAEELVLRLESALAKSGDPRRPGARVDRVGAGACRRERVWPRGAAAP